MSFKETPLKVTKNDVDLKLVFIVLYFKKLILNSLYNYQKPWRRPEKFIGRMRKKWLGNEGERSLWGNESFFFSFFFSFYFLPPGGVGEHFIRSGDSFHEGPCMDVWLGPPPCHGGWDGTSPE